MNLDPLQAYANTNSTSAGMSSTMTYADGPLAD